MRVTISRMLVGACALISAGSAAQAGINPTIWDNGPAAGGVTASQLSAGATVFNAQCADDFLFTAGATITDVHWTGAYFGTPPVTPIPNPGPSFNIRIYGDNGTGAAPTGGPADPSATALATFSTGVGGAAQVAGTLAGSFDYEYVLSTPFVAQPGVKYWLSVQAVFDFPPQWGWSRSTMDQLSESRLGSTGALVLAYWSDPTAASVDDMAFTLTGTAIPAPGALALLGLAAVVGGRRRGK